MVAHEFNNLIPGSELYFIDKCGHAPMIDLELEQWRAVVQELIPHAVNYLLSELEILSLRCSNICLGQRELLPAAKEGSLRLQQLKRQVSLL